MINDDRHIEFKEQVISYLSGELDAKACAELDAQKSANPELLKIFREYEKIMSGVDQLAVQKKYDVDAEWKELASKIDFEAKPLINSSETLNLKEGSPKIISLRKTVMRIAAALVIGLAGAGGWYAITHLNNYEQVALEEGTEIIQLPDGSTVTLNADSKLKYAIDAAEGTRKIQLIGEAFFEIRRDTTRPFIIDAGAATIEVLGTSFNVKAYKDLKEVEVTVKSGLVAMAAKQDKDNLLVLAKGNSGIYHKAQRKLELIERADPNSYAWKTRDIIFEERPLAEVVKILSEVYQQKISIAHQGLANCPLTVSFSQQELSAVMNVLCSTLDLEMKREGDSLVLDGKGCD